MRSLSRIILVVAVLLALPAARPPQQAAAVVVRDTPLPLRIVESGFAVVLPPPERQLTDPSFFLRPDSVVIVTVVENPNLALAAEGVGLNVLLRVGQGNTLVSREVILSQLAPGERRIVTLKPQLPLGRAEAARRDGQVTAAIGEPLRWRRVSDLPVLSIALIPVDRRVSPLEAPGLRTSSALIGLPGGFVAVVIPFVIGGLANPFDVSIGGVDVSIAAYDRQGRLIGGGQATVDLPPLGPNSFRVLLVVSQEPDAIARLEVTAALPYLDLAPYLR